MKSLPRWAKWVSRILFTPFGAIAGYATSTTILETYSQYAPTELAFILIVIGSSLAFAVGAFFFGTFFVKVIYNSASKVSQTLKKYSPAEVVSASIGLIAGMIVAYLIVNLYSLIPAGRNTLIVTLSILTYVAFAISGMLVGHNNLKDIIAPKTTTTIRTPKILDSSMLIDGRILDIVKTKFISGPFIIPNFVLDELRNIADNADALKRNRGRRGLDIIKQLQNLKGVEVLIDESALSGDVETKLLTLAKEINAEIVTVNYNLAKVAEVKDIVTLNINDLSNAIKPIALPGEKMTIEVVKEGKDAGQGVGYLPDGTMIVVENGEGAIGTRVEITITTSLQTSTGRIIFGRIF